MKSSTGSRTELNANRSCRSFRKRFGPRWSEALFGCGKSIQRAGVRFGKFRQAVQLVLQDEVDGVLNLLGSHRSTSLMERNG